MTTCRSCALPTVGKSSYCSTHRAEARAAWKAKISDEAEAREARKAGFAELWAKACEAARVAWHDAVPTPMVVTDGVSRWHVSEGMCGFSSLIIKPANSAFANWLKANTRTSKHYHGGLSVWSSVIVPEDAASQSYDRKAAAMSAAAAVLSAEGIKAYAESRLD